MTHGAAAPTIRQLLVTTVPFGVVDRTPLDMLEAERIDYCVNPLGRKLLPTEAAEMIRNVEVLVAGTEPLTDEVLEQARHLRLIARVGVGLDSVDLLAARRRGIAVSYTPEAPAPAVAELTIGLMVDALRGVMRADRRMRAGGWNREFGRRLANSTIGVVGLGRIGKRVVRLLQGFAPRRILGTDIDFDEEFAAAHGVVQVEFAELLREADVVTMHVPLTPLTTNMIAARELATMRNDAVLINTARGGVVNEDDLTEALQGHRLLAAAVDVFVDEPYRGPLTALDNCVLTSHMGSMSVDCRARMELEAVTDALRFIRGDPLLQPVPDAEYALRGARG